MSEEKKDKPEKKKVVKLLIVGDYASGKTWGLKSMYDDEGVLYLGTEGKEIDGLPVGSKMNQVLVSSFENKYEYDADGNPIKILETGLLHYLEKAKQSDKIHTIIIDTINNLFELIKASEFAKAPQTRAGWGNYGDRVKKFFTHDLKINKNIICLAQLKEVKEVSEDGLTSTITNYEVPIQGSNNGTIEGWFNDIVMANSISFEEAEIIKANKSFIVFPEVNEMEEIEGCQYLLQTSNVSGLYNGIKSKEKNHFVKIRGNAFAKGKKDKIFIRNDIKKYLDEYFNVEPIK